MDLDLQFRLLKAIPTTKQLMSYRKDAGLEGSKPRPIAVNERCTVQWVAVELKNKQIGIARLELAPPEFCFMSELMIMSPHRGQGVGHWFIKRIEQLCLNAHIKRLMLVAGDGTDNFYKSQAFITDPLMPRLMRKELNPFQRKVFAPS
ncbi:GNAT family N-acetyltransferase [Duganella sp. FT80W]|uniref:GNAT family N-acetyltransferase n=1 Tax=Duganella guangzhouensis TaxID=2666084 RepID=A0A6I2KSK0_9BURK|nr:GNAT family N-acetyltransferase [Duganella guangzhouensis]MRW88441.1 GNAT family N-acetyltransferase [Duganella guangzhouensis]